MRLYVHTGLCVCVCVCARAGRGGCAHVSQCTNMSLITFCDGGGMGACASQNERQLQSNKQKHHENKVRHSMRR